MQKPHLSCMVRDILRHRVWSDWAIFLNIFADLSLSNVLDEKFSAALAQAGSGKRQKQLILNLLQAIAADLVPYRPGHREPHAVKRRPNPFAYLTQPRHKFIGKTVFGLDSTR